MTDRTALYDLDAERAILGALPIQPRAIPVAMRTLDASDFGDTRHGVIYARMVDVFAATGVLDPGQLLHEMDTHGEFDTKLTRRFVMEVIGDGAPINHEHYARRVIEAATRRRLMTLAGELADKARDLTVDVRDCVEAASARLRDAALPSLSVDPSPNIAEFCAGDDPPKWVVRDLIESGDRVLVTGGEGQGKSMLLRQIAVMAAAGLHPFNWYKTTPVRALIVDLESARDLVRRKLRPLLRRAEERLEGFDPDNVRIEARPAGIDLTKRRDQTWLFDRLAASRPHLVAIGPLYKMYVGDNNEEQHARLVADILDEVRTRFGCALLIETHAPHGETKRVWRPAGSSLWLRWPEVGLALVPSGNAFDLTHWRRPRDDRAWPRQLKRGQSWPWESTPGS